MTDKDSLYPKSLTNAVSWSFLSETCIKLIQPASYFILMLMLSPVEMGLMASALVVTSFSQIFWEAGLGKELIRREEKVSQAANVAFFTNVILALLLSFLIINVPHSIVDRFEDGSEVHNVLRIMVLFMVLSSLSSVQIAILQKKLDFKNLAAVKLTGVFLGAVISLFLAYNNFGVWSLVAGALTGQMAQLVLSFIVSDWRPSFDFGDRLLLKEMFNFTIWVFLSSLLIWFFAWADSLIVGLFFGSEMLGLYRSASFLAGGFFALILGPVIPVLYSSLSKFKASDVHTRTATILVNSVIFLAVPISWSLFFTGDYIEKFLLPEAWGGFAVIFSMLALMHGYSWIVGYNGEFFRAQGKPELETLVTGLSISLYVAGYLISAQYGFEVFLKTRVFLALTVLFFHLFLLNRLVNLDFPYLISNLFICSILSFAVFVSAEIILPISLQSSPSWVAIIIFSFLLLYALLYFIRIRHFIILIRTELWKSN